MMPLTTIAGLTASALVAVAVPLQLLYIARLSLPVRIAALVVLAVALAIPVDGMMIVSYVWGLIGDPSIATVAIMTLIVIKQLSRRELFSERELSLFMTVVLAGGAFLYPLAMGLSPFDSYALGFGSRTLYAALLAVAIAAWWARSMLIVWWIVASLLAYAFGFFESTNLWNYLLDPIAVFIAIGWTAIKLSRLAWRATMNRKGALA